MGGHLLAPRVDWCVARRWESGLLSQGHLGAHRSRSCSLEVRKWCAPTVLCKKRGRLGIIYRAQYRVRSSSLVFWGHIHYCSRPIVELAPFCDPKISIPPLTQREKVCREREKDMSTVESFSARPCDTSSSDLLYIRLVRTRSRIGVLFEWRYEGESICPHFTLVSPPLLFSYTDETVAEGVARIGSTSDETSDDFGTGTWRPKRLHRSTWARRTLSCFI